MNTVDEHMKEISEIRSMMERSSKVLSLSGLSGISAGIVALVGVFFAQWVHTRVPQDRVLEVLIGDALVVLLLALGLSAVFSVRMAKRKGLPVWTATSRHMLTDLAIPLLAGGVFCLALLLHEAYSFLPGTMLAFYGLSLVSASKYALKELRYFGYLQLTLGCVALFLPEEGLNLWALGFGAFHIIYGLLMYLRYER